MTKATICLGGQEVLPVRAVLPTADELEKYRRLWRAVRLHESQTKAAIEDLVSFPAKALADVVARDDRLAACRAELDQVRGRVSWLDSRMNVGDQLAIDRSLIIAEMATMRAGKVAPDADDVVRRDAEIRMANDEIDALRAGDDPPTPGPAKSLAENTEKPSVLPRETRDERCIRLLQWLREEEKRGSHGAVARVVEREGRARQNVQKDIAMAREIEREANHPLAVMAKTVTKEK